MVPGFNRADQLDPPASYVQVASAYRADLRPRRSIWSSALALLLLGAMLSATAWACAETAPAPDRIIPRGV
jgi:hypothetical protein